ncbi:hypothetical protein KDL29_04245 [bacterium]|nr:hypothetical protein [bacterium]
MIIALGLLGLSGIAEAQTPTDAWEPRYVLQANKHTTRFMTAEATLKSMEESEWSDEDIQYYLSNALWAVYSAIEAYSLKNGYLPADAGTLVSAGYLVKWPDNPFNEWEDMILETSISTFSPGDFYWQLCPSTHYSYRLDGNGDLVPLSYQLSVFGPDTTFASTYADNEVITENSAWASVPSGSVYSLSAWTEPAVGSAT